MGGPNRKFLIAGEIKEEGINKKERGHIVENTLGRLPSTLVAAGTSALL